MRHRQQHDSANEKQRLPCELGEVAAEHCLQNSCVGGEPACQLTGSSLGEEPGRQSNEMCEQIPSQRRNYTLGRNCQQIHLHEIQECLNREER